MEPAVPDVSPAADQSAALPPAQETGPLATEGRRRRRARNSGLKLADDLTGMSSVLEEKKTELKKQSEQEEQRIYEVNPALSVDQAAFAQALQGYAERLEQDNRMNVAAILKDGRSEFEHNKWIFTVQGDLQQNLIARESELVPFLREAIQLPELFIELKVDDSQITPQDQIPYTDEEKLREMGKQNPTLMKFQEIFKARIIYK